MVGSSNKTPPRRLPVWDESEDTSEASEESSQSKLSNEQEIQTIPLEVRQQVDKANPKERCLIENVSPYLAVEYVYYMPRRLSAMDDMLTCLEYYWGIKYLTLSLDTPCNIFRVGASLHTMFDDYMWMLVPEEDVIIQFLSSLSKHGNKWYATREGFPKFQNTSFKYRFVPISAEMKAITILRQNDVTTNVQPSDVTVHLYPFQTLPLLESHLRPEFVIFEAGRRMQRLEDLIKSLMPISQEATLSLASLLNEMKTQWPVIDKIQRIHQAWMRKLNLDYILALPEFNPPSEEPEDSLHTPLRGRMNVDTMHTTPQRQNLPYSTGSGRKRKRGNMLSNHSVLSKGTLQSLDEEKGGEYTKESIASWSAHCISDEDDRMEV